VESEISAGCFSTLTISFGTTFKSKLLLELDSAASLKEKGKLVVVIDTGVVTRGSGSQGTDREKEIRKNFVENDLIKTVILLADNLFYNTTAPGNIIVINKAKKHKASAYKCIENSQREDQNLTDENIKFLMHILAGME